MTLSLKNPGDLLKLSGSYWTSFVLHASVEMGVFSLLYNQEQSASELAGELRADQRAVEMFLNALCALGLLEKKENRYYNSRLADQCLVDSSPNYVGSIIRHHHRLVPQWQRLELAILQGKPSREAQSNDPLIRSAQTEAFLMGMHNLVMQLAPRAVMDIDLSGRKRLLDLGGGPGTWAIHFCKQNPTLSACIFDLPTTQPYAQDTIEQFGLSERIEFVAGDVLSDPLPADFDVVWISQLLHSFGPFDSALILKKAVGCLRPKGLVLVHEFLLDDQKTGPLFPALFSLNMLTGTAQGQAYSHHELEEMLKAAGAQDIHLLDFCAPNDSRILAARFGG